MADTEVAIVSDGPLAALVPLAERAREYARQARAENTERAYDVAWADFGAWCRTHGLEALPALPEAVGLFLTERATTHKAASLQLRLVAIRQRHRRAGHSLRTDHPALRDVMQGIRNAHGTAAAKKEAATTEILRDAVRALAARPGPASLRDRALLLVGFAAALRRSELVGLNVSDLRFTDDGLVLRLRRRKTDQAGAGTDIGVPFGESEVTCPVRTLRAWLEASGIVDGPVFVAVNKGGRMASARLTDRSVALLVKSAMAAAGHDAGAFSGHSLRSGFVTSAARAGVPEASIQRQTGHKSLPVLRGYIRRGSLFLDNAAAKVGL